MIVLLYILAGYFGVGLIVSSFTAHRFAYGWRWLLVFGFIVVAWPAMLFDYWTDKVDF